MNRQTFEWQEDLRTKQFFAKRKQKLAAPHSVSVRVNSEKMVWTVHALSLFHCFVWNGCEFKLCFSLVCVVGISFCSLILSLLNSYLHILLSNWRPRNLIQKLSLSSLNCWEANLIQVRCFSFHSFCSGEGKTQERRQRHHSFLDPETETSMSVLAMRNRLFTVVLCILFVLFCHDSRGLPFIFCCHCHVCWCVVFFYHCLS